MPAVWPAKSNWAAGGTIAAVDLSNLGFLINLWRPSAKGALFSASAVDTVLELAVGSNAQVLTADSTAASGLKWATAASSSLISAQNLVATAESTTSAAYTSLTTAQAVTVTTGTKVLVLLRCAFQADNIINSADGFMSVEVSGATTTAASDANALFQRSVIAAAISVRHGIALFLNVTAGSNTFTAKFRNTGFTATFSDRQIIVIDLGS